MKSSIEEKGGSWTSSYKMIRGEQSCSFLASMLDLQVTSRFPLDRQKESKRCSKLACITVSCVEQHMANSLSLLFCRLLGYDCVSHYFKGYKGIGVVCSCSLHLFYLYLLIPLSELLCSTGVKSYQ